jgi:Ca2+-binding RTX toxin-like protein
MATSFSWFFLGNSSTLLDPTEGNDSAENAASFVGQTYGSLTSPLHGHAIAVAMVDHDGDGALDQDNNSSADQFTTNIGAGSTTYTFDGVAVYGATLTYADGTTATVTAVVVQDTAGNLYLAPESISTGDPADTAAYEAKPFVSLTLNSLTGADWSGLATDRVVTGFDDGFVDGTASGDLINAGYIEPITGGTDRIDANDGLSAANSNGDHVRAGAGNDTVFAGLGNDSVYGGADSDSLMGEAGDDLLLGEAGVDRLYGGDDNDTLSGGAGNDLLDGGAGTDMLDYATSGSAVTVNLNTNTNSGGDAANENLRGSGFNDNLTADGGTNLIYGLAGRDIIYGAAGNDTLYGGDANDSLYGGNDSDTLAGDAGSDRMFGGTGNDWLIGGDGSDRMDGGGDTDMVDYSTSTAAVTVNLGTGIHSGGQAAGDTLTDIENLTGSSHSDNLTGNTADNALFGGLGGDSLYGGEGNDQLVGGAGNDALYGGLGDEAFTSEAGNDSIFGGSGNDSFVGAVGDTVDGGENSGDADVLNLSDWGWSLTDIHYTTPDHQNGTVDFLDAGGAVIGSMTFSNIETIVTCYTPGTMIATPDGPVAVEELRPGDMVVTRDHGAQPLRWVGRRSLSLADLIEQPQLQPVRIEAGALGVDALGGGLPLRDMRVSPQHRMLVEGARAEMLFGDGEVLVAATHLVGQPGITQGLVAGVTYIHLLFDAHELIEADGAWSESFQPAERTLGAMEDGQRAELAALFPELLVGGTCFAPARLTLRGFEAKVLLAA